MEKIGERPHVCPLQCGAKFARKHDLQRHMRTLHSPTRPFQCPFEKCQHAFRRANSFWRHLVEDHPDKSSQHSEIYQRAVHQQKMNQDAMAAGHMGVNAVHRDSTPPSVKIEHFQGHSLAQTAMLHSQSLSSMTSTPMPSPIDIPTVYNGGAHHPVGSMTSLDTSYMDPNHPAHAASSFHQNSHHLTLDQQQQLFVQVPRLDEGMIYRGHFSI